MFVLTGPPGSGKSTLIEEMRKDVVIGTAAHFVPEVATILIGQVGIRPDPSDPKRFANFQQTLYRVQRSFEELARFQALADGKKVVILDRGSMDAAAYLPRGTLTLEQLCNTTSAAEYARYKAVAILEPAPAEVYEAMKGNNAARRENYAEVLELARGIQEAWDGHPLRRRIGLRAKSWEDKRKDAIDCLLSTIEF
jgi:predicted ATPase